MSAAATDESSFERIVGTLMLVVFWIAFTSLAAGLLLWLAFPATGAGMTSLAAGLIGLLTMPLLRLAWAMASAITHRDWLLLGAAITVLALLVALTLRDAAGLR